MTETTRTDPARRELPLSPDGEVEILLSANSLRLRGTDDDRVVVRSRDGRALDGEITIDGDQAAVRVRDGGANAFRLGPIVLRTGASVDLDIEIPRTARVAVRALSGDVTATGIAGASRWATASGDLQIQLDAGPVSVESLSGDVLIDASTALDLTARTVSGNLRVRAPRLDGVHASTTSGDVDVDAILAGGGSHAVSSVSGDVRLAAGGDLRLEAQTVTGDIRATVPHRAEGGRGRRTLVVGTGHAAVSVRTMSGDVILRDRPADGALERHEVAVRLVPPVLPAAHVPPVPPAAHVPLVPPAAPPPEPAEPPVLVAEAEAAPNLVRPVPAEHVEAAAGATLAGPAAEASPGGAGATDRRETVRMEILRALERGDLDVDAASRRLEALEEAGPRSFRGWC